MFFYKRRKVEPLWMIILYDFILTVIVLMIGLFAPTTWRIQQHAYWSYGVLQLGRSMYVNAIKIDNSDMKGETASEKEASAGTTANL